MLKEKMYVRCPADPEDAIDPRTFVCGQIKKIDDFKRTVVVHIFDPFDQAIFFQGLPFGEKEFPLSVLDHCELFEGTNVSFSGQTCKVLCRSSEKNSEYYKYYLQSEKDRRVFCASEKEICVPFHNGRIDPAQQMINYELQNPCWYLTRTIVSRSINILDHSIHGFKELAGCKIYLLPHQINTIMRCLQDDPCRYILADEVGMGKTIEASSVLKIFMENNSNTKTIIIVPDTLEEQWKTELFFKFNISVGMNPNNNYVEVQSASAFRENTGLQKWDFVIVDEVHRYLDDREVYKSLHLLSISARNILLLSATPVQQRHEEYLKLLRLLLPKQYDSYSIEYFGELIKKQVKIVQSTALILDDLEDYEELISDALEDEIDLHGSEDCDELEEIRDSFEEIQEDLEKISDDLNDPKLTELFEKIDFESEDLGVYAIKVMISFICSNYQVESNIIRNRRKLLEEDTDGKKLLPDRKLIELKYDLDVDRNTYESLTYEAISDWIEEKMQGSDRQKVIKYFVKPLLCAFFSSSAAFLQQLKKMEIAGLSFQDELIKNAKLWYASEKNIVENIANIMEDPDGYADSFSTRMVLVLNYIYEELYNDKIVLFTSCRETFQMYRKALENLFQENEVSFFAEGMDLKEIEINAYRFQNEAECRIMLCDYTGGEGRNFQCADYIVHIDLPWEANQIEQRIGRLDRLERDPSRSTVYSLVVHTTGTFEEALFGFWNEGLNVFEQSLSGMEIIMKDINEQILNAIQTDFRYGLFERISEINKLAEKMKAAVRKERNYDAAGFMFRPMYRQLKNLITYYNENENELFAGTMAQWANLAGFHGRTGTNGVITYNASSFSQKSAFNSLLIPPRWNDYMSLKQNVYMSEIEGEYSKRVNRTHQDRSIQGTFIRKKAIENDYLHFFAPGDKVFECIAENAMHSCKGQVAAFAVPANINWKGIVFTWSISPNEKILFENGISIYALSPYRHYLMSDQAVIPVSYENNDSETAEHIVREYNHIVNAGYTQKNLNHLGSRCKKIGFIKEITEYKSNIKWFQSAFPEENWYDFVSEARKNSLQRAIKVFKRKSNITGLKDEMERILSARTANNEYYGLDDRGLEEIRKNQKIILETMRYPEIRLVSAAFIWMVKKHDDERENH